MYIYVYGSCLDKYISVALDPSKQKFLAPPLEKAMVMERRGEVHMEEMAVMEGTVVMQMEGMGVLIEEMMMKGITVGTWRRRRRRQ